MASLSAKIVPTIVTAGAVYGVVAYVQTQLHNESQTMDRFFSSYFTPESEAARARVFEGATEDPRKNLLNILSRKQ